MTAPGRGPSTETARDVADMLAARGYPRVAELVRDTADEIDDHHVHQRPDGLWTTEPIPAGLAGHITGARPAARTPGQVVYEETAKHQAQRRTAWENVARKDSWEAVAAAEIAHHWKSEPTDEHLAAAIRLTDEAIRGRSGFTRDDSQRLLSLAKQIEDRGADNGPDTVTYESTLDAESVARAVAGAISNLADGSFGRDVILRMMKLGGGLDDKPTATTDPTPAGGVHPSGPPRNPDRADRQGPFDYTEAFKTQPLYADPILRGRLYRIRDDVDRLGVPTDAERVRVLSITPDGLSAMVDWPDLPAGPAHQSTRVPTSHLVVVEP